MANRWRLVSEFTREELISICEAASVPEEEWLDRDSYSAQRQVGECLMLLRAGCEFEVDSERTNAKTIWVTTWAKGFNYFEEAREDDPPRMFKSEETYYLPTRARLSQAGVRDWY